MDSTSEDRDMLSCVLPANFVRDRSKGALDHCSSLDAGAIEP